MKDAKKFLSLLYNQNEQACFAKDLKSIACIPVYLLDPEIHQFVSLNPIQEKRKDDNVTAFRNFLVEFDHGSIKDQLDLIEKLQMPFTSAIFSGNKSVHFVISLTESLPDKATYKRIAHSILTAVGDADMANSNPSRFTRAPGFIRSETNKTQEILELKNRITLDELCLWLDDHKPQYQEIILAENKYTKNISAMTLPNTVIDWLANNDFPEGERNSRWFFVGRCCNSSGYTLEEAISELSPYFIENSSFTYSEWKTALKSAFNY